MSLPNQPEQIDNLNILFLFYIKSLINADLGNILSGGVTESLVQTVVDGKYNEYFRYVVARELMNKK